MNRPMATSSLSKDPSKEPTKSPSKEPPLPLCPYCREPIHSSDKMSVTLLNRRIDANDAEASCILGGYYLQGERGLEQDTDKALVLMKRGAQLGSMNARCTLGVLYESGNHGVMKDKKRAIHHYEQAAIMGSELARYNLGVHEMKSFNFDRAMNHFMIGARAGNDNSLERVKKGFINGMPQRLNMNWL